MIFEIFKAIILGIVEGITEFLPISSTGHLIIMNQFVYFNDKDFSTMFNIVIQLGAILSVVILFWNKLFPFSFKKTKEERIAIWNTWFKTLVGVIPALLLGYLFHDFIEKKLLNVLVVTIMLIIGGLFLIYIEKRNKNTKINSMVELSYKTAFFIGLIQCLAMIPGTSRSAATIIGAMLLGASRVVAAEFSFFLAIPTMVAASGYMLLKNGINMSSEMIIVLVVGFIVSFLIALLVIKSFMAFIKKNNFIPFAYYRIILGILLIVLLFCNVISFNVNDEDKELTYKSKDIIQIY